MYDCMYVWLYVCMSAFNTVCMYDYDPNPVCMTVCIYDLKWLLIIKRVDAGAVKVGASVALFPSSGLISVTGVSILLLLLLSKSPALTWYSNSCIQHSHHNIQDHN